MRCSKYNNVADGICGMEWNVFVDEYKIKTLGLSIWKALSRRFLVSLLYLFKYIQIISAQIS